MKNAHDETDTDESSKNNDLRDLLKAFDAVDWEDVDGAFADEADEWYGRLLEAAEQDERDEQSADGPRADVRVSVRLTAARRDRIALECDADESVEEWIQRAVKQQLIDREVDLLNAAEADVDVGVPPEIAERARLRYEHAKAHGSDQDIDGFLLDYVDVDMTFLLDGEPICNSPREFDEATGDTDEE